MFHWILLPLLVLTSVLSAAENPGPASQKFRQEVARKFGVADGISSTPSVLDVSDDGNCRALVDGKWLEFRNDHWQEIGLPLSTENDCVIPGVAGKSARLPRGWKEVRQIVRQGDRTWVVAGEDLYRSGGGEFESMGWASRLHIAQIAVRKDGRLLVAGSMGLWLEADKGWSSQGVPDGLGRGWGVQNVLGAGLDSNDRLWMAMQAGVAAQLEKGWKFFEGRDGLPVSDFTGVVTAGEEVWFATHSGVARWDGKNWHYRQGPRWLPQDDVLQLVVDRQGRAWVRTASGIGCIERKSMTLSQKAELYEDEIARYIKRTPFGYVAEAPLAKPADKASAHPNDSDNDGLWTSMYGAGEAFAFASTKDPKAKERARQAFDALRFLQKVTQQGDHVPPKGFVARTIRPTDWPDPNAGRLEADKQDQKGDSLWKAYEPRWPRSADGKWYWKSDTSSDELDGHFFFYPLYFDFCADSDAEKERVREVVRDLADHLITHGFTLTDHDGKPTRWAVFGPQYLNHDPRWWQERGLNSLSILSYLAVAAHVTGDPKYEAASRELIEKHGYGQNIMYPKVQHGAGSGNQSDDEMAFMCYYNLLRYSRNEDLKRQARFSFYSYWVNEVPEMNPFFNFAYAGQNLDASASNAFGRFSIRPWDGWFQDAMATLYGFPLDRLNWPHHNSHRLDLQILGRERAEDIYDARRGGRGYRVNGKVLPIENRHFNHWNTDPWQLDYGGSGNELAAGTVFLLPYYMGLYHGFIEKP